jgi:hypothetical protein
MPIASRALECAPGDLSRACFRQWPIYALVLLVAAAPGLGAQTLVPQSAGDQRERTPAAGRRSCGQLDRTKKDAVFLDGALKGDDAKTASTATGSLGISTFQRTYLFIGQINVAAKTDTVREDYGTALLNPGSGKALKAGLVEWRRPLDRFACERLPHFLRNLIREDKLSVRAYGSVSRAEWAMPMANPTAEAPDTVVKVTPVGYGLGLAYSIRETNIANKAVAVGLTAGYAQRILKGDGGANSFDAQRTKILGTSKTAFSGVEIGLEMQFGEITGGITYYTFPRAATVPGFSRGQVIGGFSLKANVLDQ